MKKITLTITFSVIAFSLFCQNIAIYAPNGNDVSNGNYDYTSQDISAASLHFAVKNLTDNPLAVKILFNIEQNIQGSNWAYCWDQCYDSPKDGSFSVGELTLAAQTLYTNSFIVDYDPMNHTGEAIFKYSLICDDLNDTTFIYVHYNYTETAINDISNQISIYPNPCSSYFNVNENVNFEYIVVYDILGNEIKRFTKNSSNTYSIFEFNSGIYLLEFKTKNQKDKIYYKLLKQ